MATDPNMGFTLPVVGGSADTWGQLLLDALATIGAHRHGTGDGAPVPVASLRASSDLVFSYSGVTRAITSLKAIDFTPAPAADVASYAAALFANSSDNNNLTFRTQAGSNVRITNGAALDVVGSGGIGGDYAGSGAAVTFVDADDAYYFKQQGSPKPYAYMKCGPVDLYEPVTPQPSERVRLQSPAALASSYAVTWPAAPPASITDTVAMSSSGTLVVGSHGDRALTLPAVAYQWPTATTVAVGTGPIRVAPNAAADLYMSLPLRQGDRIKSISISHLGDGAADINNYSVVVTTAAGGTSSIGLTTVSNPPASWVTTPLDLTDTTLAAGESLTLLIGMNATGISLGNVTITYDRP